MSTQVNVTPFPTPTQIPGLLIWTDASTLGLANNATLSTWTNGGSGGTVNCTGTFLTNQLNSLPIVRLSTSQTWTIASQPTLPVYSMFFVTRQRGGTNRRVLQSTTNNQLYGYWSGQKRVIFIDNNPSQLANAASDSAWDLFSHTRTAGSAFTFNWNGTSQYSSGSSTGNSLSGLAINTGTYPGESSDCDVAEIILYNTLLTTTQVQTLEGYLAWKWGLQANLPNAHPYKLSPVPPLPRMIFNAWTPTQIPGCALWLDAGDSSTITTTGTTVTQWTDKSGTARTVSFVGTVSYNSIARNVFTASSYFFANVDSRKTTVPNLNVFIVYRWLASGAGTNQGLWGQDVGGGWNRVQLLSFPAGTAYSYGLSYTSASPNTTNATALNTSNQLLYDCVYSFGRTNATGVYVNGAAASGFVTEAAAGTQTATTNTYFSGIDNGSYNASIAVNEIIMYNVSLTLAQRQQIQGYLAWKWGLQGSLAVNHPYRFVVAPPAPNIRYAAWTPTQISGCSLWYDATDPSTYVTSGGFVTSWTSKGTNNVSLTQGTSTRQPQIASRILNGLNVMRFTNPGSADYVNLNNTSVGASVMTTGNSVFIFMVHNSTYQYSSPFCFQSGGGSRITMHAPELTGGNYLIQWDAPNRLSYNTGGGYISEGFKQECFFVSNGASGTQGYKKNGSLLASQTGQNGSYGTQTLTMGGFNPTDATYYYRTDIAEVILYNQAITTAQVQQVEGYLAWKWGLQNRLPANHPFAKWPPPP